MSGLPQGTCLSNLKSVSVTMLEQLSFDPPPKGGQASLAIPSVRNIPWNMLVKFEVRNFNCIRTISI